MLTVLSDVWHAIESVPYLVVGFFVDAINGVIVGIAALCAALIALLPSFPDPPSAPSGILGALLWVVPLGTMLSGFSVLVGLWIGFLAVKVGLNWVRAL